MTKDEALKLALEAIEELRYSSSTFKSDKLSAEAITAIKEALAQPEPDDLTIAYMSGVYDGRKQAQSSPQPDERNFCPRCGKRRGGDVNYIHTCTPPQETK